MSTLEARRGTGWWRIDVWGLKDNRENTDKGTCTICRKEGGLSHILKCEENRSWGGELADKIITNIEPEIGFRLVSNKK
jgi:hypothetical protein